MTTFSPTPESDPAPSQSAPWPALRPAPPLGEHGTDTPLAGDPNIQGNILAGFNKDHQMLLFLHLPDADTGRTWLSELRPRLATNDAVAGFNARFSQALHSGGADPADLSALWTNVSFTAEGVSLLAPSAIQALQGRDDLDGGVELWLAAQGSGDVVGDTGSSAPAGWLFGRSDQVIHAVVCIAADRPVDLDTELAKQRASAARYGVAIVFEQAGETLPGAAAGHEHFGFKDGISQPGVFGFDPPDPTDPTVVAGKPGTDLLAAGNFVLGYPRDDADETGLPVNVDVPKWMFDGSFLVTRRLTQDVPGFWAEVEQKFDELPATAKCPMAGIASADALAAKLVGRWRSGTPTAHQPFADNRSAQDPDRDNDFDFAEDLGGDDTPFVAHIRKVYPREGGTTAVDRVTEDQTKPRRILRRGIPFGLPFQPTAGRGEGVDAERGLVFQCYQTSLRDQFVFLQQVWINNATFPNPDTGKDAVMGQASQLTVRACGAAQSMSFGQFVRTQGSLFTITPSLDTIAKLAAGEDLPFS